MKDLTLPTPALLPCPFCGHDKPYFERMGTGSVSCQVACGNCGAWHESSDEYLQSGKSWNTRAALSSHQAATDKDSLTVAPVALGAIGPEGRAPEMLQDCDRGLSKWLSNTPDARRHAREAAVALGGEPPCNPHPDAPHGYNRNASHNAGRYVCDCEGWAALGGEKGEAVADEKLNELLDAYAEIAHQNGVEFCAGNEGDLEGELAAKRAVLALFAAPVGKARMLTDEEADHITGMHNTGRAQGDSECAEAIQRKFCEVNGITLEGGNRSGG